MSETKTSGQRITHGRHCTCSACARTDWTSLGLAPCGMHGSDCPAAYQPWGLAGAWVTEPEPSTEAAVRLQDATVVIHQLFEAVSRLKPSEADLRVVDQALTACRAWMAGERL